MKDDELIRYIENHGYIADEVKDMVISLVKERQDIRATAIDEFAEKITLEISESIIYGMLFDNRDNSYFDTADKIVDYVIDTSKKIAEQMKEGGKSEASEEVKKE